MRMEIGSARSITESRETDSVPPHPQDRKTRDAAARERGEALVEALPLRSLDIHTADGSTARTKVGATARLHPAHVERFEAHPTDHVRGGVRTLSTPGAKTVHHDAQTRLTRAGGPALTVPEGFVDDVVAMSNRLGVRASHVLAVMGYESGLDPARQNASTHATGLIQFMPANAADMLGLPRVPPVPPLPRKATPAEIKAHRAAEQAHDTAVRERGETAVARFGAMTHEAQLGHVERFLADRIRASGPLRTQQDVYMAVFMPSAVGHDADHLVADQSALPGTFAARVYRDNSNLDANRDGSVSAGEAASVIERNVDRHPALRRLMEDADARQELANMRAAVTVRP